MYELCLIHAYKVHIFTKTYYKRLNPKFLSNAIFQNWDTFCPYSQICFFSATWLKIAASLASRLFHGQSKSLISNKKKQKGKTQVQPRPQRHVITAYSH